MKGHDVELRKRIVDEYREGDCSVASLAAKYGVSSSSIFRWLYNGCENKVVTKERAPSDIEKQIIELYTNSKLPVLDIGRRFDISPKRVHRIIKRYGVYIPNRQRFIPYAPKYLVKEQVLADYSTGKYGCRALAEKYGVCFTTIARWVKELK